MNEPKEPRNPFYFLLMLVCLVFVATCLACVVVPAPSRSVRTERFGCSPKSAFSRSLLSAAWVSTARGACEQSAKTAQFLHRKTKHRLKAHPPRRAGRGIYGRS